VYPTLVRYVADIHLETFLAFLCTLALWRSVIFLEKPSPKNGALFGVCIGLGALTKPVVLLYPVAFAAFWLWTQRPWRDATATARESGTVAQADRNALVGKLLAAGAIFVAMGVVILPWTYRNYRTSGHFVLVTTGAGDAFLRGFVFSKPDYALLRLPPYTFAENESNAMFTEICRHEGAAWAADDIETERILVKASKAKLAADPGGFVVKYFTQLFTFWYQMTSLANSLVAGLSVLVLWVLALVGWRRARAEGRSSWPLFLPILCLNLSLAALLALGRYSVPVIPALVTLAAFGIDSLLPRLRAEESGR
jgi:4-amino-4-deoxy-L-arabinose transferase-like glycosyltransferase